MNPFEKDFIKISENYPKLSYARNDQPKGWIISGELDICDESGIYWDTFNIGIFVPLAYPYAVPVTAERSKIIPREIDWHISPEGLCCLDIPHNLTVAARRGLHLGEYLEDKIYPFFANQLHKIHKGVYAGEEYEHHFAGIVQFYAQTLQIKSNDMAIRFLELIVGKHAIGRNDPCPCGSNKKVKHCHLETINILRDLGTNDIMDDLKNFRDLQAV